MLLGIALETYVLQPLTSPPKATALFFPLNEWAFGLLLTKMISAFILIGPDNRLRRELNQVVQRGLNLRIWDFHQNLAFPALVIIGLILVLPRSAQRLLERLETKGMF